MIMPSSKMVLCIPVEAKINGWTSLFFGKFKYFSLVFYTLQELLSWYKNKWRKLILFNWQADVKGQQNSQIKLNIKVHKTQHRESHLKKKNFDPSALI